MLRLLLVGILVATPAPTGSFSEEALGRWPHLQRHWLQLQNKRVTTPAPIAAVSDESHEVGSFVARATRFCSLEKKGGPLSLSHVGWESRPVKIPAEKFSNCQVGLSLSPRLWPPVALCPVGVFFDLCRTCCATWAISRICACIFALIDSKPASRGSQLCSGARISPSPGWINCLLQ